jgi:hypothetical protein
MAKSKWVLLAIAAAAVGCAASPDGGTTVTRDGLQIDETPDGASGVYVHDGVEIRFSSTMLTPDVLDIVIEHSGMTLSYTADFSTGVAEFDGFVTETGEETQMLDGDRAILAALYAQLDELGADVSLPVEKLRGFANVWSEFPSTLELQGHPPVEPDYAHHRSDRWYEPWNGVQICDHLNTYFPYATHDCNRAGRGSDGNTVDTVWLSFYNTGGTTYRSDNGGGSWISSSVNHTGAYEHAWGDCFGRCGAGCGGGTFTIHCLDHDQCVRDSDHVIYSWYCDDEFVGTTDDWSFAPNC